MYTTIFEKDGMQFVVKAEGDKKILLITKFNGDTINTGEAELKDDAPRTAQQIIDDGLLKDTALVIAQNGVELTTELAITAIKRDQRPEDCPELQALLAVMKDIDKQVSAAKEAGTLDTAKLVY